MNRLAPSDSDFSSNSDREDISYFKPARLIEVLTLGLLLFYFLFQLNFHMDEAQIAYPFGCEYSHSGKGTILRESCGTYDLRLPLFASIPPLPLRVADYVGTIQGLLYYPIWAVLPNVLSVRLFRILLFWLGIWGITRVLRVSRVHVLVLATVCMPLTFTAIGFAASEILFCLTCYFYVLLSHPWNSNGFRQFTGGMFLGLLIACVIVMRLNLMLSLPGLLLATGLYLYTVNLRKRWTTITLTLTGIIVTAAPLMALYLCCIDQYGRTVAEILKYGTPNTTFSEVLLRASEKLQQLLLNPLLSARYHHRIVENQSWLEASIILATLSFIIITPYRSLGLRTFVRDQLPWFSYALVTLILVAISPATYGWHHIVPAFATLPVILSYALMRRAQYRASRTSVSVFVVYLLYFAANLSLFCRVLALPIPDRVATRLPRWVESLRVAYAIKYTFLIGDWGPYYVLLAAGDPDLVMVWPWNLGEKSIEAVNAVKNAANRPLLLIYQDLSNHEDLIDPLRPPKLYETLRTIYGESRIIDRLDGTHWVAAEFPGIPNEEQLPAR